MAKAAAGAVKLDPSMRIVVLYGDERFLIEEYTRRLAGMLEEKFGGIETFQFEGETADPAAVLDELRSYGLMQRHKLVILDHADSFLAGGGKNATEEEDEKEEGSERSSRRPLMERYAENPVSDATLLMRADTWRKGKLDKLIEKVGSINVCAALSEFKAAEWCMRRSEKRYDSKMEPAAAQLLVERLGPELLHLDTELMKLAAMAGPGKPITRALVVEAVGLSREEKAWEIQAAIATADPAAMLRKLRELLDISRQDEVPITWSIIDMLRKMHAASHLFKRRVPPQGICSQLRLFGGAVEPMLQLAAKHEPEVFAQLLRSAVRVDQHNKTGVGDSQRSLEGLLVKIADKLAPPLAA